MPFAIRERGERSKLAEHIKTLQETGVDGKPLADQTIMDAAKASALSLMGTLPTELNGALVLIDGHANDSSRSITVQVIGEKGHF